MGDEKVEIVASQHSNEHLKKIIVSKAPSGNESLGEQKPGKETILMARNDRLTLNYIKTAFSRAKTLSYMDDEKNLEIVLEVIKENNEEYLIIPENIYRCFVLEDDQGKMLKVTKEYMRYFHERLFVLSQNIFLCIKLNKNFCISKYMNIHLIINYFPVDSPATDSKMNTNAHRDRVRSTLETLGYSDKGQVM